MRKFGLVRAFLVVLALALTPMLAQAKQVWIDVRTKAEHRKNHIDGDPLIEFESATAVAGVVAGRRF